MNGKVTTHDLMTDEIYTITTSDKKASVEIKFLSGVRLTYDADPSLARRLRSTLRPLEK